MKIKKLLLFAMTVAQLLVSSCERLIEIPESKNQIESNVVFKDGKLATSALLGAYFTLGTVNTRMKYLSVYVDEYNYSSVTANIVQFRNSALLADNAEVSTLWRDLYSVIYQSNALIEGLQQSSSIAVTDKQSITAEARFLRAYAYLYLLNFFDRVPLLLHTEVSQNRSAPQASIADVYSQIVKDLNEAKTDLPSDYQGAGKVRANKAVATALLSRVYLYLGKWREAIAEATTLIESGSYLPLPALAEVFKANSKEAILQLWVANGFLSDASTYIPASATAMPAYPLTDGLYEAFGDTDGRRSKWIGINQVTTAGVKKPYFYPSKYKNRVANTANPEYIMVLRLSEQLLIRAEAYAQTARYDEAMADVNVIRSRAGLPPRTGVLTKEACLEEIYEQRQLELFGEWAHRLIDLKRTGQIDAAMMAVKPAWLSTAKVLPIPVSEITYNKNLVQNEAY